MREDWESRLDEIKKLAKEKSRKEAALILGTSTDNFRHICKRYGIDIRERKPYLKLVREKKEDVCAIEKEKALIPLRNDFLKRKWA